ncbi:MAG: acyltransferase [Symploca sp. SIO2E9]|nr:acyltransferase [Symploca sp. SIO2E9]
MGKENQQQSSDMVVRDERLDLVKAISISLVLIWHLKPIRIISGETPHTFIKITSFILDQLYLSLTLVAVPLFILTSLFILFKKLQSLGYQYLLRRCKHLLKVFIFWSLFQFSIYYLISLLQSIISNTLFSWYIPNFPVYRLLIEGGPPLPLVGGSVFYFLFILIVLTILAYVFHLFIGKKKSKFKNHICVAIIIMQAVYFEALNLTGRGLSYLQLENFLIYIPIAYLQIQKERSISSRYSLFLYIGFFVFGLQDIFLRQIGYNPGVYSRVSIIFGALAVFSSCLNLEYWKASDSVNFLSRYSLGIFAIHKYWQFLAIFTIVKLSETTDWLKNINNISIINVLAIFVALVTISLTFGSVRLLSSSPFQRFIK